MAASLLSLDEILAAREVVSRVVTPTPCFESHALGTLVDRPLWLKPEFRQRTGSFKIRGAYNLLASLPAGSKVVAASAGNHAQGVALAASLLGHDALILMPTGASLPKVAATRDYGAEVRLHGATVDECITEARRLAGDEGRTFVSPFDNRHIMAGQATIGLEVLEEVPEVETVCVAIGGGGICGGIAAAVKLRHPGVRVVGVMAAGADSMARSLAAGRVVPVQPATVADGIALGAPSELTMGHVDAFVDELVTVGDEAITRALVLLVERTKSVVEPAGAAALAAVTEGMVPGTGPVVCVLGGGNIDSMLLTRMVEHGLAASGRYLSVVIRMPDQPGSLAAVTTSLADLALNVVEVDHHRTGRGLPLNVVELRVTVETRNEEHRLEALAALTERGFEVHEVD